MNLLWEIKRGEWFILGDFAMSYLPVIQRLLTGQAYEYKKRPDKLQVYTSDTGSKLNAGNGFEEAKPGSVAVIPLKGAMTKYGTLCEYGTTEIAQYLYQAADNAAIDGVVLDVDTGGGAGNSIQPMIDAIKYVQSKGKAVDIYGDMIASAGYYVAVYANRIFLSSELSSQVGSIGIYTVLIDNKEMLEKEGYKIHEIYPPESSYKNREYKEAFEGNYELIISESLSPMAINFQEAVKANRKKIDIKAAGILNGRMFRANDAVKFGLADEIGTIDKAISHVRAFRETEKFRKNF